MITRSVDRLDKLLTVTGTSVGPLYCTVYALLQTLSEITFILSGAVLGASIFDVTVYERFLNISVDYNMITISFSQFVMLNFCVLLMAVISKILCIYQLNRKIFLIAAEINSGLFEIYLNKPALSVMSSNENQLMASLTTKSTILLQNLINPIFQIIINSIILLVILSVILLYNDIEFIVFAFAIIIIYIFAYSMIKRKLRLNSALISNSLVHIQSIIQKYQKNITFVKALRTERLGRAEFLEEEQKLKLALMENQTLSILPKHILEFSALAGIFIIATLSLTP